MISTILMESKNIGATPAFKCLAIRLEIIIGIVRWKGKMFGYAQKLQERPRRGSNVDVAHVSATPQARH